MNDTDEFLSREDVIDNRERQQWLEYIRSLDA
jgi:hypothetical protein